MSRVQSIERAFAVLGALGDGPLGVTEVADRVHLPKSTVARLLASLATEGAVEQVPDGTDYRIGGRLVTLAAGVRPTRSLVALARPHLVELAGSIGEAAGLSIPDGFLVHYVDQVDSPHPVGVRDWTGTRLPMHAVSSGLVILAHMHPADVEHLLAGPLERFTATTVVDPALIRERLRRRPDRRVRLDPRRGRRGDQLGRGGPGRRGRRGDRRDPPPRALVPLPRVLGRGPGRGRDRGQRRADLGEPPPGGLRGRNGPSPRSKSRVSVACRAGPPCRFRSYAHDPVIGRRPGPIRVDSELPLLRIHAALSVARYVSRAIRLGTASIGVTSDRLVVI